MGQQQRGTGVGRTLRIAVLDYDKDPEYLARPEYSADLEHGATTTLDILPPNSKRELAGVEWCLLRTPARQRDQHPGCIRGRGYRGS
jgi:hypothetical protein